MEEFKVKLLVTLRSGEEQIRIITIEAWSMEQANQLAKAQALLDDDVEEAVVQHPLLGERK